MEWISCTCVMEFHVVHSPPKYIPCPIPYTGAGAGTVIKLRTYSDGNGNCQIYLGTLAIYRLSFIQFMIVQARDEIGPKTATHETNAFNPHALTGNWN